jgi:hypothetical protein
LLNVLYIATIAINIEYKKRFGASLLPSYLIYPEDSPPYCFSISDDSDLKSGGTIEDTAKSRNR